MYLLVSLFFSVFIRFCPISQFSLYFVLALIRSFFAVNKNLIMLKKYFYYTVIVALTF